MVDGVHDLNEEGKDVGGNGVAGSVDGGVDEESRTGGDLGEGRRRGGRRRRRDFVVVLAPHRDGRKDEDLWIPRFLRSRSAVQSSSKILGVRIGEEGDVSCVEFESRLNLQALLPRDRRAVIVDDLSSLSVELLEVVLHGQPIESLLPLLVDVDKSEDVAWESRVEGELERADFRIDADQSKSTRRLASNVALEEWEVDCGSWKDGFRTQVFEVEK